ncbi:MAG TPA: alpha/beta fold hydrolase [Amycolatopsis sp.]|nr:alpha/beta fold hydrolase [Amycolatopsis sp.]
MDDVVYSRTGQGEPLVLIHGIGHRRQAWDPVLPLLTPHRDVITLDLPGFGESPAAVTGYGVEPALIMFKELFAELGLDRPHVAGNSLGGLLSLALGEAGLVRSVTALSPAGLWTQWQKHYAITVLRMHRALARSTPERVVARLVATPAGRKVLTGMIVGKPALLAPDVVVADALALAASAGFEPTAAQSRNGFRYSGRVTGLPVTIAWAEHDRILARPRAADVRQIAPDADLVLLKGCGHVPMNDDPRVVAKLLLDGSSR